MDSMQRFHDGREGGQPVVRRFAEYKDRDDIVVEVLNGDVVPAYNIPPHVIRTVAEREGQELQRRLQGYRGNRPFLDLRDKVDDIVCLRTSEELFAVGRWYEGFSQTTDDEVRELLSHDSTRRDQHGAYAGR